ncbi:MAG: HAMP domain-containing histidine kinase [Leptolyngbya sp. SIO1D8]|nr:HAMP domain-containing histidine kinase [Leptolyngbya sp. SIO1D8]
MFSQIRYRLLCSYLAVLASILTVFAIAIRVTFTYRLNQQMMARLETLARAAALDLEIDAGELVVDRETFTNEHQAIQWFDVDGNLVEDYGNTFLQLPFDPEQPVQEQRHPQWVRGLTIPVNDYRTGTFIGYTRVTESTADLQSTLNSLDWGLGGGVLVALGLSGLGGFWLTRQAMYPIEQSFQKLQQFTSDAAHELRSPLMAIKTNAAVALKYPTGIRASDADKFQAIQSASTQLTELTEDLLFLARSDRHHQSRQKINSPVAKAPASVNVTDILRHLLQLYALRADAKSLQLKSAVATALYTRGDKVQLTRLFSNLIDNALRYTPSGGVVEVLGEVEQNQIKVTVQDTGVGIAPEHLDLIFERFWQAEQSRTYQSHGFGLGLAIAHNIVQVHQGRITVSSELNQGSCFTVYLLAPLKSHSAL